MKSLGTILASWDSNVICRMGDMNCFMSFEGVDPKDMPLKGDVDVVGIFDVKVGESSYHPCSFVPTMPKTNANSRDDPVLILMNKICQDKDALLEKEEENLTLKEEIALLKQDLELYKSTKEFIEQSMNLAI